MKHFFRKKINQTLLSAYHGYLFGEEKMKKMNYASLLRFGIPLFLVLALVIPLFAYAGNPRVPHWGPLVSCTGRTDAGNTTCNDLCDLLQTIQYITYFGITVVVFVLAPIFLAWGAILMIAAGGSEERWRSGKNMLLGAAIGMALALGSFVIVNTVLWAIGANTAPTGRGQVAWPDIQCQIRNN